jgi:hypothetical protein
MTHTRRDHMIYHLLATDWRDRRRIEGVCGSIPKQSPLPSSPQSSY